MKVLNDAGPNVTAWSEKVYPVIPTKDPIVVAVFWTVYHSIGEISCKEIAVEIGCTVEETQEALDFLLNEEDTHIHGGKFGDEETVYFVGYSHKKNEDGTWTPIAVREPISKFIAEMREKKKQKRQAKADRLHEKVLRNMEIAKLNAEARKKYGEYSNTEEDIGNSLEYALNGL